jgi:hypothetical protein
MWSIGSAALGAVLLSAGAVTLAMRRARRELGPTLHSFDALRDGVLGGIDAATRDVGRARAARLVLLRHGGASSPR